VNLVRIVNLWPPFEEGIASGAVATTDYIRRTSDADSTLRRTSESASVIPRASDSSDVIRRY